jgi:hypothetical protein
VEDVDFFGELEFAPLTKQKSGIECLLKQTAVTVASVEHSFLFRFFATPPDGEEENLRVPPPNSLLLFLSSRKRRSDPEPRFPEKPLEPAFRRAGRPDEGEKP